MGNETTKAIVYLNDDLYGNGFFLITFCFPVEDEAAREGRRVVLLLFVVAEEA